MPSPKLYLDEHLSPRLAIKLRQYGFDVISTHEANLLEAQDERQLARATEEKRAIVTFNHRDFVILHHQVLAEGKEHWGIILSTEESVDILRRRLLRLLNTLSEEELCNQIRWLNEFK